jgi:capping protein (actin filament) muscle Z-line, beta
LACVALRVMNCSRDVRWHHGPAVDPNSKSAGTWDSIHVFESLEHARTAHYKHTSTVILNLGTAGETLGEMDLSGNMTRQVEQDLPYEGDESHIANLGRLVEDMELKMRNLLRTCTSLRSRETRSRC